MTKAEEIYHRFVHYEWNEIGEGMKKSILDAINEALRQPPVIKSLPEPDEIRMKARELDEKDFAQWMYELQKCHWV